MIKQINTKLYLNICIKKKMDILLFIIFTSSF